MSKNNVTLTPTEIDELKTLADDVRRLFGVHSSAFIAGDIKKLLEKRGILICEYPFNNSEKNKTYAYLTVISTEKKELNYIGLNTSVYYDKQLFALGHELYHFDTKTGLAYTFNVDEEDPLIEKKADRFAAELFLPEQELKHMVVAEFGKEKIKEDNNNRILRFIATVQTESWIPYKAIVNRLKEERYISNELYSKLYGIDARDENGVYYTILNSLDSKVAKILNEKTNAIGISNKGIEYIIKNYEDGYIDDDEFTECLSIFNRRPEDYGYELVDDIDDEMLEFFKQQGED